MLTDLSHLIPLAAIPVGLILVGYVVLRRFRSSGRPLARVGDSLEALANQAEIDLVQLQLEDASSLLSQGWNRLIAEVSEARRELEAVQVQQQARETIDRYRSTWVTELLDHMPYGLLMVSDDLAITFANAKAERLLGQDREELLDCSITEVFDGSLESLKSLGAGTMERTFGDESPRVPLRLTAIKTEREGQIAVFLQDVSHQMEIERARDQFLYHVTHELRTPLTNIRAYAETLSEGVLQDRDSLRECYNVIISETERLGRLVEDILSVSQLEAGSARLEVDDVQTARLVRQVVEDMQAAADEKNIELILSLPSKVPTLRGDKERLAVVLTNLIGNAIKYTPSGGQVEVTCVEDGARLQIAVRDTGIGIDREEQAKVFNKFYRSTDEKVAKLPGTGLGLAIARETIRSHGGTIELESEPNKGSTFIVSVPVGKSAGTPAGEAK